MAPRREGAPSWLAPFLMLLPAMLLILGVVLVPLAMTALLSFHSFSSSSGISTDMSLANWAEIVADPYYMEMFLRTFRISGVVTLACCLIGAPEAYIIHRMQAPWKGIFLVITLGPLLISVVARTLGWALLFGGRNGVVNKALMDLGILSEPIPFMFTEGGVMVALTHVMMPFMVLSVWAVLQRLDPRSENAAASLGASQFTILSRIVLPQVLPGILSGAIIVFALSASSFATPAIVGGRRLKVAATLAYDEFLNTLNWPLGAAVAVLLLIAIAAIVIGCNALVEKRYSRMFQ
nr:ABC transporter permease [Azorhizobium oxalatiphilum]